MGNWVSMKIRRTERMDRGGCLFAELPAQDSGGFLSSCLLPLDAFPNEWGLKMSNPVPDCAGWTEHSEVPSEIPNFSPVCSPSLPQSLSFCSLSVPGPRSPKNNSQPEHAKARSLDPASRGSAGSFSLCIPSRALGALGALPPAAQVRCDSQGQRETASLLWTQATEVTLVQVKASTKVQSMSARFYMCTKTLAASLWQRMMLFP